MTISGWQQLVVGVSGGHVYTALVNVPEGQRRTWRLAQNVSSDNPPLVADDVVGRIWSVPFQGRVYFVDGRHYVYYDPNDNKVHDWNAQPPGSLPRGVDGECCRLIEVWGGRIVLAGMEGYDNQIFMSAIGDAEDWDYSPPSPSSADACTLSTGSMGLVGQAVMSLKAVTENILYIGTLGSVELLNENPLAGGQKLLLTSAFGTPWGRPWTIDHQGNTWVMSSSGCVYWMRPGESPVPVGQAISPLLSHIDTGRMTCLMECDDRDRSRGVYVVLTENNVDKRREWKDKPIILFYELETGAWWRDEYSEKLMGDADPTAMCVVEGNRPQDRGVLIGGWDGRVRMLDPDEGKDDGHEFLSEVMLGPLLTPTGESVLFKSFQSVLGEKSGSVQVGVHVGDTADQALASVPAVETVVGPGRSLTHPVRRAGYAVYAKLSSWTRWCMERMVFWVETQGDTKRRGR